MKRRNPLLVGLLNIIIPGSSHLYVSGDWSKFIPYFVVYSLMILFAVLMGNNIQELKQYTLPQGLCTGILLVGVFTFLFYNGMKEAVNRDSEIDSAAYYQSMRTDLSEGEDPITKLANIQRQREEGLISKEQEEIREAQIKSKKT